MAAWNPAKLLATCASTAVALLATALPASAAGDAGAAHGVRGCLAQQEHSELRSRTCPPDGGFHPPPGGLESNHNETLLRDAREE